MEHDIDAFESAYGRLAGTRLSGVVPPSHEAARDPRPEGVPQRAAPIPRSRLLPRLALLAPRRRPTPFGR